MKNYLIFILILIVLIMMYYYYYLTHGGTQRLKTVNSIKNEIQARKNKIQQMQNQMQMREEEQQGHREEQREEQPGQEQHEDLEMGLIEEYRNLYKLYHDGLEQQYDAQGRRIEGFPPNPEATFYYINQVLASKYGTSADLMYLAKAHHYGFHTYEPDLDKAEEIYRQILDKPALIAADQIMHNEATENLENIRQERIYRWLNLPLPENIENARRQNQAVTAEQRLGRQFNDFVANAANNVPRGRDDIQRGRDRGRDTNVIPGVHEVIIRAYYDDFNQLLEPHNETVTRDHAVRYKDDAQNTHDSGIVGTTREAINNLLRDQGPQQPLNVGQQVEKSYKTMEEIRKHIMNMPENDIRMDALTSLNTISRLGTDKLSSTNMNELEALDLIWSRIKDRGHTDAKEILVRQLADMQQNGITVCKTGRFNRIMDTLNGIDEAVNIRPSYALNEEMLSKAAKIREDLMNKNANRRALEENTASVEVQTEFDRELRKTIEETLYNDYVTSGIMTEQKLTNEISKWIDHI